MIMIVSTTFLNIHLQINYRYKSKVYFAFTSMLTYMNALTFSKTLLN